MTNRKSLENVLAEAGNTVDMLRNSSLPAYVYSGVPGEFTNWRDEQRAWRETAVLFDQSHHMTELLIEGPDARRLLERLAVNSFEGFVPDKAKQFVACAPDGHIIGDAILFYLGDDQFNLVGRVPAMNWVTFHAETGGYDVTLSKDNRTPGRLGLEPFRRRHYRYQIQGPNAPKVIEKLNGGPVPKIRFFNMDRINIAGREVRALRHGMSGVPGLEIWGPYEEGEEVRSAILDAGREFGLQPVGARAYATNTLESGWIPWAVPAIYAGEATRAYREWLPGRGYEASSSLGGSFYSENIEDYYLTPYELGYGPFVKFDHDFVGREALEEMAARPQRRKVTFQWHPDDVAKIYASFFRPDEPHYKYLDLPLSNYTSCMYDRVMIGDRIAGFSMFTGCSYNERSILSLGCVDPDVEIGDILTLVWGEENGGTRKVTVERPHLQAEVRVKVCPVPFAKDARETYAEGWRTRAA